MLEADAGNFDHLILSGDYFDPYSPPPVTGLPGRTGIWNFPMKRFRSLRSWGIPAQPVELGRMADHGASMGRATVLSRRECRSAVIWSDGSVVREVTVSRSVGWNIECL